MSTIPKAAKGFAYYLVESNNLPKGVCVYCKKDLGHPFFTYDLHHSMSDGFHDRTPDIGRMAQDVWHPLILFASKTGRDLPGRAVPWDGRADSPDGYVCVTDKDVVFVESDKHG